MKVFFTRTAGPIPAPLLLLEGQDTNRLQLTCSEAALGLSSAMGCLQCCYNRNLSLKAPGCADGAVAEGGSTKDKHRPLGREAEAVTPRQQSLQKPKVEHKSPFFLIVAQDMRAGMRLL